VRRIASLGIAAGLGILALIVGSGTSMATAPTDFSANWTYRATIPPHHSNTNDFKIRQKNQEDIVMRELTILPGGSSGWHSHPGPTYVIVIQGTDSLYEAKDPECSARNYLPGEGFVELPGDVHISRNEGATNTVLLVTFLDVPVGGAFRLDAPRPGNCPF
jgi:quercetin dioxygenase-like cupin family protein